jgi:hypothetical protein
MSKYSVLIARLHKELTKIQVIAEAAVSQTNKAKSTEDVGYLQTRH